jgi:hypothetical protein
MNTAFLIEEERDRTGFDLEIIILMIGGGRCEKRIINT